MPPRKSLKQKECSGLSVEVGSPARSLEVQVSPRRKMDHAIASHSWALGRQRDRFWGVVDENWAELF